MADEVYWLDPEWSGHRQQVQNNPEYRFFQAFGKQVPREHWNPTGTKQGIYVIGPNSEYLGARFSSPTREDVIRMLKEALTRWESVAKAKGYQPKPIPALASGALFPEKAAEAGLWLQVNSRDLPRRPGGPEGARFTQVGSPVESWGDFRKWAWNQDFFAVAPSELNELLPSQGRAREVSSALVRRLVREQLVDNVRGQVDEWQDRDIREAFLRAEPISRNGGIEKIRYRGIAKVANGARSFSGDIFGIAEFDHQKKRFRSFRMVAVGTRSGKAANNNRNGDEAPAPIGYALAMDG